jgi:hypothetical protein
VHRFEDRIRFVYRHFPLEEVHPHALHAAEAAECAGGQGKFWPMHDLLFENQPHLKLPQLRSYAERLDLDLPRYVAEMKDQVYLQRIREHIQSGREFRSFSMRACGCQTRLSSDNSSAARRAIGCPAQRANAFRRLKPGGTRTAASVCAPKSAWVRIPTCLSDRIWTKFGYSSREVCINEVFDPH